MNAKFEHMGPLYRKRGLNTETQLIAGRIESATAAYGQFKPQDLPALLRTGMGISAPGDLATLAEEVRKSDPTFDPAGSQPEMTLMAAAILRQAIEDGDVLGERAALAVVATSFGGLRVFEADPDLLEYAKEALADLQDVGRPNVSANKTPKRPNLEEEFSSLQAQAQGNNFGTGHAPLKQILEGGFAYTETAYRSLALQFNALANAHNRLSEEMNVHWWVLNGWSHDARQPFGELGAAEAALRAGVELARLTKQSSLGLFAAPALLSKVLKGAGFEPNQRVALSAAIVGCPVEWRNDWARDLLSKGSISPLLPVTLAAASAAESNDERDWEPRFERATRISPTAEIELLGLSHQAYLESVLRPQISA